MAKTLKIGAKGSAVKTLQSQLKKAGFSPGTIDGNFGPATEAAVIAFQRGNDLLADGIVGPKTRAALNPRAKVTPANDIPKFEVGLVARMFPFTPLDNIKTNLPFVLDALKAAELADAPMVLMALATIRAETASFRPIDEGMSRYNTSPGGHPFDLYDHRADLGNTGAPDGASFKGRGYIQLTGRDNYRVHGRAIGLKDGLIRKPERANEPDIAASLLASFLKSKERRIKEALLDDDLRLARRLVNGGRHGLEQFSEAYRTGKQLLAQA